MARTSLQSAVVAPHHRWLLSTRHVPEYKRNIKYTSQFQGILNTGVGKKMAQQFGALVTLAGDPGLVPSTYRGAHNSL